MRNSICLGLACTLVGLCTVDSTLAAAEKNKIPDRDLARYVVEHLDVTTFPSSIGPRREAGKITFKDYGLKLVEVSDTEALVTDEGWMFEIRVLRRSVDSITICLHDQAANGGTYNAQECLLLKKTGDGDRLIAARKNIRDKRCPEFAK